ncbi:AT-rich interactive domain-containing protein 3A [Liparis tanakae]|uniref:AT-rich interactive domain-containing protein 3A n=1 Tax=Liparis tanakae TaxID=230148 RepID=A0A4Z2FK19_9TELE|nr:AT-rich interactive domain-containing protein 3A [Liparis tanakae]
MKERGALWDGVMGRRVTGWTTSARSAPPPAAAGVTRSPRTRRWRFHAQALYELDDDEKRKEFLDDLFSFMQKRDPCLEP